jgi:hypothetical protein
VQREFTGLDLEPDLPERNHAGVKLIRFVQKCFSYTTGEQVGLVYCPKQDVSVQQELHHIFNSALNSSSVIEASQPGAY